MNRMAAGVLLSCVAFTAGAVPPNHSAPRTRATAVDMAALRAKMDASKAGVDREKMPGAAIYHRVCEACHEGHAPKAPARTFIEMMTPEAIDRALTVGIMRAQAAALSAADKRNVAEYLSGVRFGAPRAAAARRAARGAAAHFDLDAQARHRRLGLRRRTIRISYDGSVAGLPPADIPRLKVKWAFAYPGVGACPFAAELRLRRAVRRQPERHRLRARCASPAASAGHSRRRPRCARRSSSRR